MYAGCQKVQRRPKLNSCNSFLSAIVSIFLLRLKFSERPRFVIEDEWKGTERLIVFPGATVTRRRRDGEKQGEKGRNEIRRIELAAPRGPCPGLHSPLYTPCLFVLLVSHPLALKDATNFTETTGHLLLPFEFPLNFRVM